MTTLYVLPNFKFKKDYSDDGSYLLIHPQFHLEKNGALFGHYCSSLEWAFSDLQYPNRKDFLDTIFGKDNWQFELYEFTSMDQLNEDMKHSNNPQINTDDIVNLFDEYKKLDKHL